MPTYANDIQQVSEASISSAQLAVQGATAGVQQYASIVTGGMERMMADLGRMMPAAPSVNVHPFLQARHGMYGHEMSVTGDIKAMFGAGTPETTTLYEYQAMAREDIGRRVGMATTFGGMYAGGAAAGWVAGGKALGAVPGAFRAGRAFAAARGAGAVGAAAMGGLAATGIGLAGVAAFTAIDASVGKIVEDVQDRQDVMNFLEASSFRYMQ